MIGSSKHFNRIVHVLLGLLTVFCILPFMILAISSFSSETSLITKGYSLFPSALSLDSYRYLFRDSGMILRAYTITVSVTAIGTTVGLIMMILMAYALSIPDLPGRKVFSFLLFFTMLFNGGLVPSYIIWTNVFRITNTLFALILPRLLVFAFYIIIMRSYFQHNVPVEILEAARIDGAGEMRTLIKIVLPMSVPIIATVGLMQGISYWNDWLNGLYYVTDSKLYSIQNILNRMLQDAQFLATNSTGVDAVDLSKVPHNGIKMAVAMLGAVPIIALFPFFQKYYVRGLTIGAVKG